MVELYNGGLEVVRALGEIGIGSVYPIIPFDDFPTDQAWYEAVVNETLQKTITSWGFFDQDHGIKSVNHSIGCLVWAFARNEAPELFGDTALQAPTGASNMDANWQLRPDLKKKVIFMLRYIRNALQYTDTGDLSGTFASASEVGGQIWSDIIRGKILKKFATPAKDTNLPQAIVKHSAHNKVSTILGIRDPIINIDEYMRSLGAAIDTCLPEGEEPKGLQIVLEDIPHLHYLQSSGRKQLLKAADNLVNNK